MNRAAINRAQLACAFFGLMAIATAGCGGGSDNVEVFPVKGTVTYDGKPMVGGGSIALVPVENKAGKTAGGIINEDGTYVLTTYDEGDGSMPGEFRVVITQVVYQEPDFGEDSDESGDGAREAVEVVDEANRIPQIYADPANSPLTISVEEKDNQIDIPLTRQ